MSAIDFGSERRPAGPTGANQAADDARLDEAVLLALDDPNDDRARGSLRVLAALAALAPDAVTPLVAELVARVFSPGPYARREALADALAAMAAPDTSELSWHLDGDDEQARALAARALAAPRHVAASPGLRTRLVDDDEHDSVRVACARALAGQADASAVEALSDASTAAAAPVRRACAAALGKLGSSRRASTALVLLCADSDADVRVSALTSLLVVGGPGARRAAVSALSAVDAPTIASALLVVARHGQAGDVGLVRPYLDAADARVRRAARACVDGLSC